MDIDAWNHWLLLRPLLVFILAVPLIVAALLIGMHQGRRQATKSRNSADDRAAILSSAGAEPTQDVRRARAEAEPKAADSSDQVAEWATAEVVMPREWDGGPLRPNLNRQMRLGSGLR